MDNKKLILIIDDEPYNIFALKLVLKSKGYAVLSSASLAEGLEILHQHKNINIVLMDMMMPEIDGYEGIARIRGSSEIFNDVTIIAVTAQAMSGDREKCLSAGADGYISKPIDIDELIPLIEKF
ncbi:response regulator [Sphingobacterium multivorum]|uniref:Response regulator n=1 Tax=Sphingobacterium multivorum TaxID=28454 RepID=A0A654DEL7_SPHMU|nr:response regulator [Sphingobacterium multivorum]HAE66393.1 response regulator [Sphingobacterium sp.]QQT45422.1 response regulator [Sphingobacterium multivorum]SUJ24913.1 Polar-differentiation response regulator divK [Sphingobacterium multivorum]VXD04383.1 Response regulator [Sphingobacterium multivorum]HBI90040.1 response regulator [Sphingobacterium sp.]